MKEALPAEKEAQAQQLAQDIARLAQDELLHIARTLIDADDASLFGDNEFTVRDLVHQVAAKAYQQRLAQKKTATKAPQ
jgi:hypothetical protein